MIKLFKTSRILEKMMSKVRVRGKEGVKVLKMEIENPQERTKGRTNSKFVGQ
jgi:hypothetical protein